MSNPQSPVDADTITINVTRGQMLVIRCEAVASVLIVIKVGVTPTTSNADYFLTGGDAVEIRPRENTTVNILRVTGAPKVYWRLENLSLVN
jgi:hypothetical protein